VQRVDLFVLSGHIWPSAADGAAGLERKG